MKICCGTIADMSVDLQIPVYTHIYGSKAMTLIARQSHQQDKDSLIRYLDRCGLLGPRLNLAAQRLDAAGRNPHDRRARGQCRA